MFCYRLFKLLTSDETLLNKVIIQALDEANCEKFNETENESENESDYSCASLNSIELSNNIYYQPYSNFLISVVYRCESELYVIREQIVCLSHILSKEINPEKYRYEFICLVPPHMEHLYDKLVHLSREFTAIHPILTDNLTDLGQFMIGGLYSKGKFVVDARYLASELDSILSNRNRERYVKCIKPVSETKRITRFLPIVATKDAVSTVFVNMHLTGVGAFAEFEFLCFCFKVTFDLRTENYTKILHPAIESLCASVLREFVIKMHVWRFWSARGLVMENKDEEEECEED